MPAVKKYTSRTERYLDFMLCVFRADGVVTSEERDYLVEQLVDDGGFSPELTDKYRKAATETTWGDLGPVVTAIADGLDIPTLTGMVRDAYVTASADGDLNEAEVAIIRKLVVAAGIPGDRFESIDAWAREAIAHLERGHFLLTPESEE